MDVRKTLLEFVGTFLLVLAILYAVRSKNKFLVALLIGLALFLVVLVAVWLGGDGNVNPAVSTVFYVKGDLTTATFISFVIAQILGALVALWVFNWATKNAPVTPVL